MVIDRFWPINPTFKRCRPTARQVSQVALAILLASGQNTQLGGIGEKEKFMRLYGKIHISRAAQHNLTTFVESGLAG